MTPGSVDAPRFIPTVSAGKQRLRAVLFLVPLMAFFSDSGWAEQPAYQIDWNQSLLSVTANQAPLDQVFAEVIARTGLEVRSLPAFPEVVSVAFVKLPLSEGLQKLLAGKSYFILDKQSANGAKVPGILLFLDSPPSSAALPKAVEAAPAIESGNSNSEAPESLTELEKGAESMESGNGNSETTESLSSPEIATEGSDSETLESLPQPEGEAESSDSQAPDRLSQLDQAINADAPDLKDKLYSAIQDEEPLVRELAYRELFQRGDATALDLLRRDARSENVDVRRTALDLLSQLTGEKAVDVLSEAASDSNIDIRQMAMENLAKNPQGVEIIKDKLRDPNPEVRMAALESLASLGNESAAEAAATTLHDSDEQVRSRAEAIRQELQAIPTTE